MVDNDTWLKSAELGAQIADHLHKERMMVLTTRMKDAARAMERDRVDAATQARLKKEFNENLLEVEESFKHNTRIYFRLKDSHEKVIEALRDIGQKYDALAVNYNALVRKNHDLKDRLESSNQNLHESKMKVGILDQEIQSVLSMDKHEDGFNNGLERLREANDAFDDEIKKNDEGKFYIEE